MSSGRGHTGIGLDLAPTGGVSQVPMARLAQLQSSISGAWKANLDPTFAQGYWAHNADLAGCAAGAAGTAGIVYLARFVTPPPGYAIGGIQMYVTTANGTPTAAENWLGIYDGSNGATAAKLYTSPDMSTPWGSTGLVTVTPSTPVALPSTSTFAVAWTQNGTTKAIFAKYGTVAGLVNQGAGQPASWSGHTLTGQTTLPATIDFTSTNITQDAFATWCAVYYVEL